MSELDTPATVALFPPLVLAIFITCVAGAAAITNFALIAALIKRFKNGVFSFIIQLALADLVLLTISICPELWYRNIGTWEFGKDTCIAFRGITTFASTATIYLVASIALHTIATINIEEKMTDKKNKRITSEEDEEMRSSRHSLVANSDSSTPPRTMNVDYRPADKRVQIAPPTFFVWFLSASLSIPEFTFANTIHEHDRIICSLADTSHKRNMHVMTALFNFFLPILMMTTISIIIGYKLKSMRRNNLESVPALRLSLCLIAVYFIVCVPRSLFNMYGNLFSTLIDDRINYMKNDSLRFINLICSSLFLLSTLLRPLLCITLLPRIRKKFTFGHVSEAEHV